MSGDARRDPGEAIDDLVDRFAVALKAKLRAAEAKRRWDNAWAIPDWEDGCRLALSEHVAKGDPVDVAAYSAFCWHHGWPTAMPVREAQAPGPEEPVTSSRAPGRATTFAKPGSVVVIPSRPMPEADAARIRDIMAWEDAGERSDLVIRSAPSGHRDG